jgi:serine/threonine protein phosphatase PrpC
MSDYGARTCTGTRHTGNQDALGMLPLHGLAVVADGMGGHAAGEVASRIARDLIVQEIARGAGLVRAIRAANAAVRAAAEDVPSQRGMGTTVVAAQIDEPRGAATVAWVGDSRAYLWREGELRRVTRDHSLVQRLIDRGEITPAEAERHPERNVLVRCLGFETPEVDAVALALEHDDLLLLCTDGVTGELSDARVAAILAATDSPQAAADALIDAVVARQGQDDATVVVVRYAGSDELGQEPTR